MRGLMKMFPVGILVLALLWAGPCFSEDHAQQEVHPVSSAQSVEDEKPEKITPGPNNIKEQVGIYVFLAWLWLSIFVLVYFIRMKVREEDRLYNLGFYKSGEKGNS